MTPQDYFDAGQDLLADGGVQAVTIANLCDRLGVTKGSFYHHFRSVEDFHDRLLDDWFTEHVARRKAVTDAAHRPAASGSTAMRRFAVDRRHDTEGAIRGWARSSPRAAEVQRRIDNNRLAYVVDVCRALGIDRRARRVASPRFGDDCSPARRTCADRSIGRWSVVSPTRSSPRCRRPSPSTAAADQTLRPAPASSSVTTIPRRRSIGWS